MSIENQPAYAQFNPVVNYPEPPPAIVEPQPISVSRSRGQLALVLVALALALMMMAACMLWFVMRDRRDGEPVPVPVATATTTTVTATPVPTGDAGFISALHMMGYPVMDEAAIIKVGHDVCAKLRTGHGVVPRALAYVGDLAGAPEGFNQADVVAFVWAAEDAYCPEEPRQ